MKELNTLISLKRGSGRKKIRIAICHYKIRDTDGVSLEIAKRAELLKYLGHQVITISGVKTDNVDYVVPELDFNSKVAVKIKKNAFGELTDYLSEKDLLSAMTKEASNLYVKLLEIYSENKFDYLFVHNIFSHGRHIAAAKAFYDFFSKTKVKVVSFNHDFYTSYGRLYSTNHKLVQEFLSMYVPPKDSRIRHVTINSIMQKKLKSEFGLGSQLFPDTFNFKQPRWSKDNYNSNLEMELGISSNDLVILHATRIVERKSIEMAFQVVKSIYDRKSSFINNTLYNGKTLNQKSKVIFLLPGLIEPASKAYAEKLKRFCKYKGVKVIFANNLCRSERNTTNGKRYYSLWDFYALSDIVTYTSTWEGWGNQFIEAVFAKKPIIIFEYPVYLSDIKREGYNVFSLGGNYKVDKDTGLNYLSSRKVNKTVDDLLEKIFSVNLLKSLNRNFEIGNKFHGQSRLQELLLSVLD